MNIIAVILAGGQGLRMSSNIPKVLQPLAGKPLLSWVVDCVSKLNLSHTIVVVGEHEQIIKQALKAYPVSWVRQELPLGTGDAVKSTLSQLLSCENIKHVLVLCGDVPNLQVETLKKFIANTPANAVGLITAQNIELSGYGRIKRKQSLIVGIVEEKDATHAEKQITEINAGIYLFPYQFLIDNILRLETNNNAKELYITDLIEKAVQQGIKITDFRVELQEVCGVNTFRELHTLEREVQLERARQLLLAGTRITDLARLELRNKVTIGTGVSIDVNVILDNVVIENNVVIGANVMIQDSTILAGTTIEPFSHIVGSQVG